MNGKELYGEDVNCENCKSIICRRGKSWEFLKLCENSTEVSIGNLFTYLELKFSMNSLNQEARFEIRKMRFADSTRKRNVLNTKLPSKRSILIQINHYNVVYEQTISSHLKSNIDK